MRSIRCLGVIALVAMSLTVLSATASASGGIVADEYPATVKGSANDIYITFAGGKYHCTTQTFTGTLSVPSTTFTPSSMTNPSCSFSIFKMNGCKWQFSPGSHTLGIGPAGCEPMKFTDIQGCEALIGAQSGIPTTYKDEGTGTGALVVAQANTTTLKYTLTGSNELCGKPGTTHEDAGLNATWNVSGTNGSGKSTGVYSDGSVRTFLSGEKFTAEAYPADITGKATAPESLELLKATNVKLTCGSMGANEFTGASTILNLDQFFGCNIMIGESKASVTEVKANGCKYRIKSSPEGAMDLTCASESSAIEFKNGLCNIKILPQSFASAAKLANSGTGIHGGISVTATTSGVKYAKVTGPFCFLVNNSPGTMSIGALLTGALH